MRGHAIQIQALLRAVLLLLEQAGLGATAEARDVRKHIVEER